MAASFYVITKFTIYHIERIGTAAALLTRIREVLSSILGWDISYPD
jgi:hypothetical protein